MSEQQGDVRNHHIPRKAVFKVRNSTNGVIERRELISYPANALSQNLTVGETDSSRKIEFLLSGDCMMDGKESFITLQVATNKWSAVGGGRRSRHRYIRCITFVMHLVACNTLAEYLLSLDNRSQMLQSHH